MPSQPASPGAATVRPVAVGTMSAVVAGQPARRHRQRLSDERRSVMPDDPGMDRPPPRAARPSILLVIGCIGAIVGLTLGVIDRDRWSAALGTALLILAALAYVGARRRRHRI